MAVKHVKSVGYSIVAQLCSYEQFLLSYVCCNNGSTEEIRDHSLKEAEPLPCICYTTVRKEFS